MSHMAQNMVPLWTHLLGGSQGGASFLRLDSWTPPWTRLLGDLGSLLVAIWLHFGALELHFGLYWAPLWSHLAPSWCFLAVESCQNEHHRPQKTKSIKKRLQKNEIYRKNEQ